MTSSEASGTSGDGVLQQVRNGLWGDVQLGERKYLLSQIFQRGSYMIHILIVYYQETIVASLAGLHLYLRVLAIVLPDIQFQLIADGMGVD